MTLSQFLYLNDRFTNALSPLLRILLHPSYSTSNSITSKLVAWSPPPFFPRLLCTLVIDSHSSNFIIRAVGLHSAPHRKRFSVAPTVNLPNYLSRASVKKRVS